MKNIIIVQRIVPHYRIPFYNGLYEYLLEKNIKLTVIYGQEKPGTVPKSVFVDEPWAVHIENKYYALIGKELVWQPCLKLLKQADLIIFEQANRLLINYLLLSRLFTGNAKLAFWGHGKNFQSTHSTGILEKWKKTFNNAVDWWFTYTPLSTELIELSGFPIEKITTVFNSIDDSALRLEKEKTSSLDIDKMKQALNIDSDNMAIYCGGMYTEKRLAFLLEACDAIKKEVPNFHILFIGSGPDQYLVEAAAKNNAWIHYLGHITGSQRVPYFLASKVLLMPGLVGLVLLDSFLLETPLITTNVQLHSPEIAYLHHDVNGLMIENDLNLYVESVVNILLSPEKLNALQLECVKSSHQYTLENMVHYYGDGIIRCVS